MAKDKLFISYRREDTATISGRVYDWLTQRMPKTNVFFDVDLEYGVDFMNRIQETIMQCKAIVVMIGPHWLIAGGGPSAYVTKEIELALSNGVRVMPVLVGDTTMPAAEHLPPSIRAIPQLNAARVRDGRDFQRDMADLAHALGIPTDARFGSTLMAGLVRPKYRLLALSALLALVGWAVAAIQTAPGTRGGPPPALSNLGFLVGFLATIVAVILYVVTTIRQHKWGWLFAFFLAPIPGAVWWFISNQLSNGHTSDLWTTMLLPAGVTIYGIPGVMLVAAGAYGLGSTARRISLATLILLLVGGSVYSVAFLPQHLVNAPVVVSPQDRDTISLATTTRFELRWKAGPVDHDHDAPTSYHLVVTFCPPPPYTETCGVPPYFVDEDVGPSPTEDSYYTLLPSSKQLLPGTYTWSVTAITATASAQSDFRTFIVTS